MTTAAAPAKKLYWVGVAIIVVSIGVPLGIGLPRLMSKVRGFQRVVMPGTQEVALSAGEHTLFFEQQSVVDGKVYVGDPPSGLRCAMASPDGAALEVSPTSGSTTYQMGSYQGVAIASVKAAAAGRYQLTCQADGAGPFVIAFGQGMMGAILMMVVPAAVGAFAGTIFMFIIWRRRRRAARAA